MTIVLSHSNIDITVHVDVGWAVLGRIPCNGVVKQVPGGVVRIGGMASEGVSFIWSLRYTV